LLGILESTEQPTLKKAFYGNTYILPCIIPKSPLKNTKKNYLYHLGSGFIHLVYLSFFAIVLDAIILVIIGIRIFILSRHLTSSERKRFDFERKWFWITIELSLIMLITWSIQVYVWIHDYKMLNFILSDCILLLTALTIFIILIGRKNVKILLFENLRENESTNV